VITTLNEQVKGLQGQVEENFGRHPDAEIYRSQPGMGTVLGARVLGEFGDAPHRYADGKARRNYAATSPITRASGKKKVVAARFIHNGRLVDALMAQAFTALNASPGARAFYDELRARGIDITTPCGGSPTGSSASCTDASRHTPSMTRQPPGRTGKTSLNLPSRLDI
jgi:transposase